MAEARDAIDPYSIICNTLFLTLYYPLGEGELDKIAQNDCSIDSTA